MIDFHNHILPGIDDGAKNIEVSINMLREAHSQGVSDVVNTVHYQHPKMDGKSINEKIIKKSVLEVQDILDSEGINIKIHIGAEVFFLPNLPEIIKDPITTIGNGKYMLIEFPIMQFPHNYEETLFQLCLNDVTPVIAHPERYREIQFDLYKLEKLFDRGYVVQLDAGSILGHFGKECKKVALKIIDSGLYHLIGSDAHNDRNRNFCLEQVRALKIPSIVDNEKILFFDNPNKLINGEPLIDLLRTDISLLEKSRVKRFFSKSTFK